MSMKYGILTGLTTLLSLLPLWGQAQPGEAPPEFLQTGVLSANRFCHHVRIGSLMGQYEEEFTAGVSMEYVGSYLITPYLGVGLGAGAQTYRYDYSATYFPVWINAKGYLKGQRLRPYGQFGVGYGMGLDHEDGRATIETAGGLNLRGGLGFAAPVAQAFLLTVGLGYQYQSGESRYQSNPWWGGQLTVQELRFRRIHLQIGILF